MGRDCLQRKVRVVEWRLLGPSLLLFLVLPFFFPFLFLWPAPVPFLFNFLGSLPHTTEEKENMSIGYNYITYWTGNISIIIIREGWGIAHQVFKCTLPTQYSTGSSQKNGNQISWILPAWQLARSCVFYLFFFILH
jgi:hypothetical protein